jgi:hypothetical protein
MAFIMPLTLIFLTLYFYKFGRSLLGEDNIHIHNYTINAKILGKLSLQNANLNLVQLF